MLRSLLSSSSPSARLAAAAGRQALCVALLSLSASPCSAFNVAPSPAGLWPTTQKSFSTTTTTKMSLSSTSSSGAPVRKKLDEMDLLSQEEFLFRNMSRERVWQLVADTDLFSRAAGKGDATVSYPTRNAEEGKNGAADPFTSTPRRNVAFENGDSYQEFPFEWDNQAGWWSVTRYLPEGAPAKEVFYFTQMSPGEEPGTTRVEFSTGMKAHSLESANVEAMKDLMKKVSIPEINRDSFQKWVQDLPVFTPVGHARRVDNTQLDVAQRSLLDLGEDPEIVNRLVDHLQNALDSDVAEMQPKKLARRWTQDSKRVVDCFLRAGRIGLLEPRWSFVCPSCRGSKGGSLQLQDLKDKAHCDDCNISIDSDPRKSLQLVFAPSHQIVKERVDAIRACTGSPTLTPHVWAQALIEPGETRVVVQFSSQLPGPSVRIRCPNFDLDVKMDKKEASGLWILTAEGKLEKVNKEGDESGQGLVVENSNRHPVQILLEEAEPLQRDALLAQEVLDNPGFGNLFGSEEWQWLGAMSGVVEESFNMGEEKPRASVRESITAAFPKESFDIGVLGSGPAGETLSLSASRLGAKVVLVERAPVFGGPTGLGSKAFREAALKVLSWDKMNEARPSSATLSETFNKRFGTYLHYAVTMVSHELMCRLNSAGVTLVRGCGRVEEPNKLSVARPDGTGGILNCKNIALCVGSRPARPLNIPFDGKRVLDGEEISKIAMLPKSIAIIGGGIIAMEYASIFGALGVETHVINSHSGFLPMLEVGLCDALLASMAGDGVVFHRETKIQNWDTGDSDDALVSVTLSNDKILSVEMVLYGQGREGVTDDVASEDVKLDYAKRGFFAHKDNFNVGPESVYAIGDVVGGGLASTAAEHGEALAHMLFAEDSEAHKQTSGTPLVLWTIPEVASTGMTRKQAEVENMDILSVRADFRELPRGLLTGCLDGYLEMVVSKRDGKILGTHLFGPGSSELVHFGSSLVSNQITVGQLVHQGFAAVTLHCLFHLAAERAYEQLKAPKTIQSEEKKEALA